ncbi:MAG: ferric iron uptake transcriptional regulator [Vibrionaceae bacterium]
MPENNHSLKKLGLKVTSQRLKILALLQQPDHQHVNAEEIYRRLLDSGEEIGLATVYRVLNQFEEVGLITRHHFEGGKSVFELTTSHHHDHLVCLNCSKVIEFKDDIIEKHQKKIAKQHNFKLTHHSLFLYGYCENGVCDKMK